MGRLASLLGAVLLAAATWPGLASAQDASVHNRSLGSIAVHEIGGILVAGQPTAADLALARGEGIHRVINLRHASEPAGFDEPAEAARLGLEYISLPWSGPDELTDTVFDEVRALLRESPRPLLFHCASGNRVAAVWLPWRVLDEGADWDSALAEAQQLGLRSPALEARARAYVDQQSKLRCRLAAASPNTHTGGPCP
ncbi:MAG: hypothetical protein BroJett010_24780 [Gammaproteobacteria bacterium]|jgi:uncharacterized protein (TIGR01244 family)|nr:MAG: hypothetical protein EDM71_04695 [Pseudomonadota bacterium]MBC6945739.1 hypothetical protein [Gammaproteobacteria bacterium]MCE7897563.1 hypothetical protein [Gammaproteobacteria bacterium PRO8]MDL1881441.1 hypothetical protein [Gammaproteobacteria bacterium PRO2]MCQ3935384.1 hypothetical protein [Gammaproteobacteria bacterium]